MYCSNCGERIPDGSRFCPACGTKLDDNHAAGPRESNYADARRRQDDGTRWMQDRGAGRRPEGRNRRRGSRRLMIPLIAAGAAAAVAVILFVVFHRPTVNLSRYVTISIDGYDSYGTASWEFDSSAFHDRYDGVHFNKKALQQALDEYGNDELLNSLGGGTLSSIAKNYSIADFFGSADYYGSLDRSSGLSNGDTVTFSWDLSEDDLKELGDAFHCRLKADDVTEMAENLQEIEKFDAFEGMSISYDGIAPDGRVSGIEEGSDPACAGLEYTADPAAGLSNGDQITVTVTDNGSALGAAFAEQYGKLPKESSEVITVSGLTAYVQKEAEIPANMMTAMQNKAEEVLQDYVSNNWYSYDGRTQTLNSADYIGNYLLTDKGGDRRYIDENRVILVYRLNAHIGMTHSGQSWDNDVDSYWYCSFRDLMINGDGSWTVDLDDYEWPAVAYFQVHHEIDGWPENWDFSGYEDLASLEDECVTSFSDGYNIENDINENGQTVSVSSAGTGDSSNAAEGESADETSGENAADESSTGEDSSSAAAGLYQTKVDASDGGVWLRADAGTGNARLMSNMIPNDTILTITEEKRDPDGDLWGRTEYNGITGWIYLAATVRQEDSSSASGSNSGSEGSASSASGQDLSVYLGQNMQSILSALPGSEGSYGTEDLYNIEWNGCGFASEDGTSSGTAYWVTITPDSPSGCSVYGVNCSMSESEISSNLSAGGWTWSDTYQAYVKDGKSIAVFGGRTGIMQPTDSGTPDGIRAYDGMPAG